MFTRVLVANRGEIVRRVARTCRTMGIEVVAIHSDADTGAGYLLNTDLQLHLPGSAARDTYLNIDRIVALAVENGVEAIHPGYGFLSENADFVRAVEAAGIVFIGPTADSVELLGDKGRAKRAMQKAGVPTVPGSVEATADIDRIVGVAADIGYPLLLKPSAGGGGKGMTVVREAAALRESAIRGVRLAEANFGDGSLIVERFVECPRHVEVQVFGDGRGEAVHVFERECSLQRRHQKVIEEAPALRMSPEGRERLLGAALRGARAISYRNAGTFEFIANGDEFYFLEVNTRLQVEHPVSEELTGIDLVEWQLRVAAGEPLPRAQHEIAPSGAAVEARIYAEDPENDFLPSPGRAHFVRWPSDVRVEAAFDSSGDVPPQYDPMIAKIIAKGDTRTEALDRMRTALRDTEILGLATNVGFLLELVDDPAVREGAIHTQYLDGRGRTGEDRHSALLPAAIGAAATLRDDPLHMAKSSNPWRTIGGDRPALNVAASLGQLVMLVDRTAIVVDVEAMDDTTLTLRVEDSRFELADLSVEGGLVRGRIGSLAFIAHILGDRVEMMVGGKRRIVQPLALADFGSDATGGDAVAPMHGVIVDILVREGDTVAKGDPLLVIEAMKMENTVRATSEGVVTKIDCAKSDQVASGQLLIHIAAGEQSDSS